MTQMKDIDARNASARASNVTAMPPIPRTRSRSRLRSALVASIVVNVFLLGVLGSGLYRWHAQQTRLETLQQRGLRFAAEQLPLERRQAFAAALKATRRDPEARALARTARNGRMQIAALLSAPDLDQNALRDALAQTREADVALRARIETTVATFAATLTPVERAQMVDAMERHGPLRAVIAASGAAAR